MNESQEIVVSEVRDGEFNDSDFSMGDMVYRDVLGNEIEQPVSEQGFFYFHDATTTENKQCSSKEGCETLQKLLDIPVIFTIDELREQYWEKNKETVLKSMYWIFTTINNAVQEGKRIADIYSDRSQVGNKIYELETWVLRKMGYTIYYGPLHSFNLTKKYYSWIEIDLF